ncbi:hypothetical protein ANO14919_129010 [Xylariales sp. No.14919]|nr:hypothetical protein ANO14919_129010 [Xylariales sp. No.14919]
MPPPLAYAATPPLRRVEHERGTSSQSIRANSVHSITRSAVRFRRRVKIWRRRRIVPAAQLGKWNVRRCLAASSTKHVPGGCRWPSAVPRDMHIRRQPIPRSAVVLVSLRATN